MTDLIDFKNSSDSSILMTGSKTAKQKSPEIHLDMMNAGYIQ
jgi:hypothetical protein